MDKLIEWNPEKNRTLKALRGVSFEEVADIIRQNKFIANSPHYNQGQYPHQRIFYVLLKSYVYVVPYVEDQNKIFLKTIIPSRKANKKYNPKYRRLK